ncbi:MAG: circularly permuted type 2 ATP-grasp protein [SAR324 cluster bacterium]|nr:circularly permuted type 2 ATP-grasp protein [SAR324 cluster bacterium]
MFLNYQTNSMYDEMFTEPPHARDGADLLVQKISSLSDGELLIRQSAAEKSMLRMGITFNVYGDQSGKERIFPFDIIPRIFSAKEWKLIEKALKQRISALNLFIHDIYHEQKILKDKVIPEYVIYSASTFRKQCVGLNPPRGVWAHISGIDMVREKNGQMYVLEDNLRCPSGVSYVLKNRQVMKQVFPQVFEASHVAPVDLYPNLLYKTLRSIAPEGVDDPTIVVLSPGMYNSAYFEHSFLAQQMGVPLVEGSDLVVKNGFVQMSTTRGLQRVDVIYRRIDDDFIDPLVFNKDSMLGVPGLMDVYMKGRLGMANAPGTGIADDKVVYAYVPQMIKYYLGEEILIPNVPTYLCWEEKDMTYVLEHIDQLVVKAANEAGGYGMLVGPHSTKEQQDEFRLKVKANPRNYIAQPTLTLSRVPTIIGDHLEGRHVDFRPFVLYGEKIEVLSGGLTRVALKKGSLVVNSSQGGGSKDTWVIQREEGEIYAD